MSRDILTTVESGSGDTQERVFGNVYLLVEHLEREGFKVSKSKAYRDKRKGILRVQKDGVILPSDARAYALTLRKVGTSPINQEEINKKKTEKEIEKYELQIEKMQFDLDRERGKYVLRSELMMEMSARATVLDLGLRHMVHTRCVEWARLIGGKEEKVGLMMDSINRDLDELLNSFAAMDRFQVVFIGAESPETAEAVF